MGEIGPWSCPKQKFTPLSETTSIPPYSYGSFPQPAPPPSQTGRIAFEANAWWIDQNNLNVLQKEACVATFSLTVVFHLRILFKIILAWIVEAASLNHCSGKEK